ncbi:X antigen family member 5-like [Moschus berezovskii]|uniref:X antigen family member 5-like n=1 Tax=Moschus berezovskii TaxID=68408 RepID=UPI002443DB80|nr:X antigen family member 5-like [Moschus berezovskii]
MYCKAHQQPTGEQPPQEEPPGSEDVLPGQRREDEGAPVIQGPNLQVDRLELTGGERGDGLAVRRKSLPNHELTKRQVQA